MYIHIWYTEHSINQIRGWRFRKKFSCIQNTILLWTRPTVLCTYLSMYQPIIMSVHIDHRYIYKYIPTGCRRAEESKINAPPHPTTTATPAPTVILCRVYAAAHTSTVTKQPPPPPPPGQTPQRWSSSAEGKGTQVEGWACLQKG